MICFNEFVKQKRLEKGLTLREFCEMSGTDPSNWSKVERGKLPAPSSGEFLSRIGEVLDLTTDEKNTLTDLAVIGNIPDGIRPEERILEKLPIFFRTVRGEKPTEAELQRLINILHED